MPIFGRKQKPPDEAAAIDAFWEWWVRTGADWVARSIAEADPQRVVNELSSRIEAIQDALAWELAPGSSSEHLLVVSPQGNPELRAAARRWLRAAPRPSATWQYADARQASDDLSDAILTVNGTQVPLGDLQVRVEQDDTRLAVSLFHATFADIPEKDRRFISILALDNAIGEAAVETWIGVVEPSSTPLEGAVPLGELRGILAAHQAEFVTDEGEPVWRILSAEGADGPTLVSAMVPLSPTYAADLDQHVPVVVPYRGRTEAGFPDRGSLDALRQLEDHLQARLGTGGLLVAHETCAGRRTLHFYVDLTGPGAEVIRTAASAWSAGPVQVSTHADPGWEAVRPFG